MGDDGLMLTLNVTKAVMLKKALNFTLIMHGTDDFAPLPIDAIPQRPVSTETDPDEPQSCGAQSGVEEMPVGKAKAPDYID
jgi:hypothetical protein